MGSGPIRCHCADVNISGAYVMWMALFGTIFNWIEFQNRLHTPSMISRAENPTWGMAPFLRFGPDEMPSNKSNTPKWLDPKCCNSSRRRSMPRILCPKWIWLLSRTSAQELWKIGVWPSLPQNKTRLFTFRRFIDRFDYVSWNCIVVLAKCVIVEQSITRRQCHCTRIGPPVVW